MKNGSIYMHIETDEVIEISYRIEYTSSHGFYKYNNAMGDLVVCGRLIKKDVPHTVGCIGIIYAKKLKKEYRKIGDL